MGYGSEVLSYDTLESTDHFWAPRVNLYLTEADFLSLAEPVNETLRHNLPPKFRGYSTNMVYLPGGDSKTPVQIDSGPVNHLISITTTGSWFAERLGIDPRHPLSPIDWLIIPQQRLLELTAGPVYPHLLGPFFPIPSHLPYPPP